MIMNLTAQQKRICERVINVFESGSAGGDYGAISIYNDGPGGIRQVTYGRSQTTEYGNLRELIRMYVDARGTFSNDLLPYVEQIGITPLVDNNQFKQLLRDAGRRDQMMQQVQDAFFDKRYFQPAMEWAGSKGFILPLSALVIYDSFVHSGSIPGFLRERFPEAPPAKGGDEKAWIAQYVDARHHWLSTSENEVLRRTMYRTSCFKKEIARGNWSLSQLPIDANGVDVTGN
jgi:chitosanase